MNVIDAQIELLPDGGILYDAARIRKPTTSLFTQEFWAARGALRQAIGGRASICFIRPGDDLLPLSVCTESGGMGSDRANSESTGWVLRHYRRGGLVAKVLGDRYLWTSAERTRCFREWRLLKKLTELGLPVPAPVAARFLRSGVAYRADLITVELPFSQTLAASIVAASLPQQQWRDVGRTIARFHAHGVHHVDLNAHNILLGVRPKADERTVFILDFDRGRIRERGNWEQSVLQRLRRSLDKITAQHAGAGFGDTQWRWLLEGLTAPANSSSDSRTTIP